MGMNMASAGSLCCGLLLMALCGGCASVAPGQRLAEADALAGQAGWRRLALPAAPFTLAAYVPPLPAQRLAPAARPTVLTVYIEGDGLAWLTPHTRSDDPTPVTPVALQLALKDGGAAAYLARPCQYQPGGAAAAGCPARYWDGARYAPDVIAASGVAIDQLKRRAGARRLVLVGYSGGGAVAALVAAGRDDVDRLVTLAANLDTADWVRRAHLQPLDGSLNPADAWQELQSVPQRHYAGADDAVVAPDVLWSYAARFPAGRRPPVIVLPGYDHRCCWVRDWPGLLQLTAPD